VDTTWKFKEMIAFRDRRTTELELVSMGFTPDK
jgi:3'-phosphoadenosine 5'-phosphosulfate sulfotransferase (PAPS reductase)/FAD synthetase